MIPTPLARVMIDPVRQSLQGFEATLKRVDRFDPATARKHFTVGMRDVRELTVLPNLLRAVARAAPFIDIAIVRAERKQLERELAAGTLDAAIDVRLALSDEVRRQLIGAERLVVVARPRHLSVRRGLDLETYLSQEHILVSSRRRGFGVEDYELSRHGLKRRIRLRCQHYFAACRVVSETDLILTMAERYARIVNRLFRNRVLPFPLEVPDYDAYLYWHVNAEADRQIGGCGLLAGAFRERGGVDDRESELGRWWRPGGVRQDLGRRMLESGVVCSGRCDGTRRITAWGEAGRARR